MNICPRCGENHGLLVPCETVVSIPNKKEMIRVVTKLGHAYDLIKPPDFSMLAFMTSVKANGHIMNEHMYQPLDQIVTIFVYAVDNPPKEGQVLQFPSVPA